MEIPLRPGHHQGSTFMPYLRCDDCGAKALPIATRCPACEAPFEARGPGTSPTRLRACPACDSLVPRSAERCRWCDEELGGRLSPRMRSGIAAGFVVLLAGGWALMDARTPDVVTLAAPESEALPSPSAGRASSPPPTVPPPVASRPSSGSPSTASPPSTASATASEPVTPPARTTETAMAPTPTPTTPSTDLTPNPARASAAPVPAPSDERGWVQAVARTFVNVRSAPGSDSEVQGVVPENAVVFLGDARGAWRQVRAGSVAGWAWEPLFRLGSEGP